MSELSVVERDAVTWLRSTVSEARALGLIGKGRNADYHNALLGLVDRLAAPGPVVDTEKALHYAGIALITAMVSANVPQKAQQATVTLLAVLTGGADRVHPRDVREGVEYVLSIAGRNSRGKRHD